MIDKLLGLLRGEFKVALIEKKPLPKAETTKKKEVVLKRVYEFRLLNDAELAKEWVRLMGISDSRKTWYALRNLRVVTEERGFIQKNPKYAYWDSSEKWNRLLVDAGYKHIDPTTLK